MWLDWTHSMLFEQSSCVCMPSFRPVAPSLFLAEVPFLAFFEYRMGVTIQTYLKLIEHCSA